MTSIKKLEKQKEKLEKQKTEADKKKQLEKDIRNLKHGGIIKALKVTKEGFRIMGDGLINAGKKIVKAGAAIGESQLQSIEESKKQKGEKKESREEPREDVLDTLLRI